MGKIVYLLDTNILSEPARKKPESHVLKRFQQHDGQFATASTVWHELQYGCDLLPASRRKNLIQSYLSMLLDNGLIILPFEQSAAEWFAHQRAILKKQGKTATYADGEIAAVAVVNNLILVTRNTSDFKIYPDVKLNNWFE